MSEQPTYPQFLLYETRSASWAYLRRRTKYYAMFLYRERASTPRNAMINWLLSRCVRPYACPARHWCIYFSFSTSTDGDGRGGGDDGGRNKFHLVGVPPFSASTSPPEFAGTWQGVDLWVAGVRRHWSMTTTNARGRSVTW